MDFAGNRKGYGILPVDIRERSHAVGNGNDKKLLTELEKVTDKRDRGLLFTGDKMEFTFCFKGI